MVCEAIKRLRKGCVYLSMTLYEDTQENGSQNASKQYKSSDPCVYVTSSLGVLKQLSLLPCEQTVKWHFPDLTVGEEKL